MPNDPTTPTTPISQPTTASEPVVMPPSEPEAPRTDFTPEVVNNTTPEITENKAILEEIELKPQNTLETQAPAPSNANTPEIPIKPEETSQPAVIPTAQMSGSEPLQQKSEPLGEQGGIQAVPVFVPPTNPIRVLLDKARNAIQFRKRKKLDKIMTLFLKKQNITNDEVEKLLHVSDATATRYLSALEKENKIKQSGRTGKAVSYSKI